MDVQKANRYLNQSKVDKIDLQIAAESLGLVWSEVLNNPECTQHNHKTMGQSLSVKKCQKYLKKVLEQAVK